MRYTRLAVLIICLVCLSQGLPQQPSAKNKVLLFLIDGVRWDYIHGLPAFEKILENGVRAEYLSPIYPSATFPNFATIFTGLYAESHGLIDNVVFDPLQNKFFKSFTQPSDADDIWYTGTELWTVAKNQGLKVVFYRPGCEPLTTKILDFCIPNVTEPTAIDNFRRMSYDAMEALEEDKFDVAAVYYENIDAVGHAVGPNSPHLTQAMNELDDTIDEVLLEMEKRNLSDNVNVAVFSDHGMIETDATKVIDITQYITRDQIIFDLYYGATVSLWVAPENITTVYQQLKDAHPHLNAYLKNEIPERYHLKNSHRTPPIWLRADLGWYITTFMVQTVYPGWHGYDNDHSDMRGIFTAMGPDFRKNYQAPGIPNVDLYNLFCHLVDIEPAPNNGTWDHVSCMLKEKEKVKPEKDCWFSWIFDLFW